MACIVCECERTVGPTCQTRSGFIMGMVHAAVERDVPGSMCLAHRRSYERELAIERESRLREDWHTMGLARKLIAMVGMLWRAEQ